VSLVQLTVKDKARGFGKYLAARLEGRLYSITLELTRRCNAKYDYCGHWREPHRRELSTVEWVDVVRRFDPINVTVCGGEPLIRPDAVDITRAAKHLPGYRYVSIITNGWFLDERRAQALLDAGTDQINVSLNWPDERHDAERKLKGLFGRIRHIVPWLAARGANVQLNSILMKDNLDEALPLVRLAESWGAKITFTLYSDLPAANTHHLFPPELLSKLGAVCDELRRTRRTRGVVANEDWYLEHVPRYAGGETIGGCTAGKRTIHVTPGGMVRACAELPSIAHYTEFDLAKQPWTDCTACFQACRGEVQAPITILIRGGVVFDLTGPLDRVDALRAITHVMAARFNVPSGEVAGLAMMDQVLGSGGQGSGRGGTLEGGQPESAPPASAPAFGAVPPARAVPEDLNDGGRLVFIMSDPAQANLLGIELQRHIERNRGGNCRLEGIRLWTPESQP
jgi:MoaA/NifB/PqqE/SkfB family radical SAM enzyme